MAGIAKSNILILLISWLNIDLFNYIYICKYFGLWLRLRVYQKNTLKKHVWFFFTWKTYDLWRKWVK